jgi:hypothetical protein
MRCTLPYLVLWRTGVLLLEKEGALQGSRRVRIASVAVLFLLLLVGSVVFVYAETYVFTLK